MKLNGNGSDVRTQELPLPPVCARGRKLYPSGPLSSRRTVFTPMIFICALRRAQNGVVFFKALSPVWESKYKFLGGSK